MLYQLYFRALKTEIERLINLRQLIMDHICTLPCSVVRHSDVAFLSSEQLRIDCIALHSNRHVMFNYNLF